MGDDSLDKNILLNTLMTKFSRIYQTASQECCLFVLPRNKYLKFVNIDEKFIMNHILKPSKLLKLHYTPYKKCSVLDVEIENDYLIVQREGEKESDKIKIIDVQDAYNENNKAFKIYTVEKPLNKLKITPSMLKEEPLQTTYFTFEECQTYLTALSPVIVKETKAKTENFLKTYLILADYLEDAAHKLKGLIDFSKERYLKGNVAKFDEDILVSSLECYILNLSYDKIMPVVKEHYRDEDNELKKKMKRMSKEDLHFVSIGCNKIFQTYQPSESILNHLTNMLTKKSPLEKIYLCKRILDKINDELNEFLNTKVCSPFSKSKYEILTDDLVAVVVYVLIKFNLKNLNRDLFLISEFGYISTFSFYLSLNSSAYGYSLTTFEVAVNYIKDYHFDTQNKCLEHNGSFSKSSDDGTFSPSSSIKSFKCSSSKIRKNSLNNFTDGLRNPDVKKQLNFLPIKFNEDLEEITKIIEENSFSFQQLKDAESD